MLIDIHDLNEVIVLLEKHHSKHHYTKSRDLHLPILSDSTLNTEEDKLDVESLASWLLKADDVESPTIDTLIAALRGIGETNCKSTLC